jgi:hypothetical protein
MSRGAYGIPEEIGSILRFLENHPHKLEKFDWVVPAFRHHPRCKAKTDSDPSPNPPCRRWDCGIYSDSTQMSSNLAAMKAVAVEIGADFDPEFGDYIMRKVEGGKAKERGDVTS